MKRALTIALFAALALALVGELVHVVRRSQARAAETVAVGERLQAATATMGLLPPPGPDGPPAPARVEAPALYGVAHDEQGYSLASMRGGPVLLVFLRPSARSGAAWERHGFEQQSGHNKTRYFRPLIEEWKKAHEGLGPRGLNVLGAVREPSAAELAHVYHVGFPIIGDLAPRFEVAYRLTEGRMPGGGWMPRALLIDKRGVVMVGHRARPGPPPLLSPKYARPYDRHFFFGMLEDVMQALSERYLEFAYLSPRRIGPACVGGLIGAGRADDPFLAAVRAALPRARSVGIATASGRARSLFRAADGAGETIGWARPIEVDGPAGEPVQVLFVLDAEGLLRAARLLAGPPALEPYLRSLEGLGAGAPRPAPPDATAAAIDRELGETLFDLAARTRR